MEIIWSEHARKQLTERTLSQRDVIQAVTQPDKTIEQDRERFLAVKTMKRERKKYLLVVVYDERDNKKEIVTAFLTTKFKKYL